MQISESKKKEQQSKKISLSEQASEPYKITCA